MKKVLLTIIALFVLCANQAQGANLNKYSNDNNVISALNVLENIGANDVFERLDKSSTRIIFYDLTLMSFSYAKDYAVSSTDENGNNYILINEKFRNSPKEAIACLIAHESVHVLPHATLDEEVRATTTEALTWLQVRRMASQNLNDDLIKRENKLAMLYQSSTSNDNLIKDSILNNSFYQQQLAMK
jgi:hypothetical protein